MNLTISILMSYWCIVCSLKVPVSKSNRKSSTDQDLVVFSSQPCGIESSSDDHSSPPANSQVSSCAVSRRTSIGPHLRSTADDGGHISISESHENSIVRAKQQCAGPDILNFEHLKMQLDKLTGQNREKQRQSDAEGGNNVVSPSPSCASISSQTATTNLPCVGSWPSGLDRTSSIESDVLLPADSGISSLKSVSSVATDSMPALLYKSTEVEQKLLLSDAVCAASPLVSVQGDLSASGIAIQQMRHESLVSSHHHHHYHHHQHVPACHDTLTQPTPVSTWPRTTCPQLMNAGNTSSAFHQPDFLQEFAQPTPAYCTPEWQQQILLQQALMMSQQMQAQHPVIAQCQQVLRLQQQLQHHQQAVQMMQSTLLQSQYKPHMHNAFVSPVPVATDLSLQYLHWQTQLTSLLTESGLPPGKAHEIVQQLQYIMIPCPLQNRATPLQPLLTNTSCSIDPFSQLHNHLLPSQFSAVGLPSSLLTSWSNIQFAYANVVQLLARPNPLITPELLESMFAQLPPPLNFSASNSLNSGVSFESLHTKFLELLLMQIGQPSVTPTQLTPPPSMSAHFCFGNSVTNNGDNSSIGMNKIVGSAAVQSMVLDVEGKSSPITMDSKQLSTPVKATRACYAGADGSVVTQACSLNRGASVDSESGDIPGAKIPGIPRSSVPCSRHHSVPAGNGVKVSVPKKNVDCPQGLADLDMALKEKLRPRTTKGVGHTAVVVSSNTVCSVSSTPSLSATAPVTCDFEQSIVTNVNASSDISVTTPRSTSSVVHDASAMPKQHNISGAKFPAAVINEKTDAVKKPQVPVARETVCKGGDVVAAGTASLPCTKTVPTVSGNVLLPDVNKDVVKPASSSMCMNVAPSPIQLVASAKSLSQCRECISDYCLPSTAVSDSAIAATTTQLAQRHLQKKMACADQENVSAIDVTTWQSHPVTAVSYTSCIIQSFGCSYCIH